MLLAPLLVALANTGLALAAASEWDPSLFAALAAGAVVATHLGFEDDYSIIFELWS